MTPDAATKANALISALCRFPSETLTDRQKLAVCCWLKALELRHHRSSRYAAARARLRRKARLLAVGA